MVSSTKMIFDVEFDFVVCFFEWLNSVREVLIDNDCFLWMILRSLMFVEIGSTSANGN